MTDEKMVLIELVEKAADADLVHEMLTFAADRMMDAEAEALTGAAKGTPTPLRENQCNGYRQWDWDTRARRIVGYHRLAFGRGLTVYDPWQCVPVLAREPGALSNSAPFKDWVLPASLERVRRNLGATATGRRSRSSAPR